MLDAEACQSFLDSSCRKTETNDISMEKWEGVSCKLLVNHSIKTKNGNLAVEPASLPVKPSRFEAVLSALPRDRQEARRVLGGGKWYSLGAFLIEETMQGRSMKIYF